MDAETNPLLSTKGQKLILSDLRDSILYNQGEEVIEVLAGILALVTLSATQFQIELPSIVEAIHLSNMTKLDEDGNPIFRPEDRKVMKGPNYVTPTENIKWLVFGDNYAPASE